MIVITVCTYPVYWYCSRQDYKHQDRSRASPVLCVPVPVTLGVMGGQEMLLDNLRVPRLSQWEAVTVGGGAGLQVRETCF